MISFFFKTIKKSRRGQAMVEYIMLLSFISVLAFQMMSKFGSLMGTSVGGIGNAVSDHLTVGVCPQNCYYKGFAN